MKKKTSWVKVAAILTTVVGAVVAIAAYLKNKSKRLSEELDFDNSLYFDEDNSMMDDDIVDDDSFADIDEAEEESVGESPVFDSDSSDDSEEDNQTKE